MPQAEFTLDSKQAQSNEKVFQSIFAPTTESEAKHEKTIKPNFYSNKMLECETGKIDNCVAIKNKLASINP